MSGLLRAAIAGASVGFASSATPMRVVVTGAGGQTGGHVFRKMLARPQTFAPLGITRTEDSRQALLDASGAAPDQVLVVDVAAPSTEDGLAGYAPAFLAAVTDAAALVIGTSAKVKPTGGVNPETGRPNMGFPDGQPYVVDWLGQKHQIDAAVQAGVKHVVICSSMGGTNPENMLNRFGRQEDGKTGGGILLWKRKAEKYLMDSGLKYTIVHPGGLINEPGGRRPLVVGVDDKVMSGENVNRTVPREDVAEVLLQSLIHEDYQNRSFDVRSEPETGAEVVTDFATLLAPLQGSNCDYSLGVIPDEAAARVEEGCYSWDNASKSWQSAL